MDFLNPGMDDPFRRLKIDSRIRPVIINKSGICPTTLTIQRRATRSRAS